MHKEEYKKAYKRVELPKDDDFFHLECPACQSKVASENININDKIAKCNSCDSVFSFQKNLDEFAERKTPLKKPVGVDKIHFGDEMEMSMKLPANVLEILGIAFLPLVSFFGGALYFKSQVFGGLIALIASVSLFAFILFRVLHKEKRRVYFVCQKDQLIVEKERNKLVKEKVIKSSELAQIYVGRTHNGYAVKAILNTPEGQVHKVILDYLKTTIDAKYVEQEIEKYYGIPNEKISVEI